MIHEGKKIAPKFSEKVPSFTVLIGSGKDLKYISPELTDPDSQLNDMKFKMEPILDCSCFKIEQNKNQFEMTLKNEKLEDKNVG